MNRCWHDHGRGWFGAGNRIGVVMGLVIGALVVTWMVDTALAMTSRSTSVDFSYRLVFVRRSLSGDRDVEDIRRIVERSSQLGFNGLVLSSGFDAIGLSGDEFRSRLRQVKAICQASGMSLIPLLFSVGYASGTLDYDRNLAAAVPLRNVPFVVENGAGVLVEDPAIGIKNGGFETFDGRRASGFDLQDGPGSVSFQDTVDYKEGKSSIRLENFGGAAGGYGRVMQEIVVHAFRCCRVTLWVKTEGLDPVGSFQVLVMTRDGRVLMEYHPSLAPTGDWREISLGFNSLDYDTVRLYAGVWGGRGGRLWIDDIRVRETGLVNVVRRPGTPVDVRNAGTGATYIEGEDFARIEDPKLSFELDHDPPAPVALPGGRIHDGDRVYVGCYQALALGQEAGQVCVCMSEPRVYEIWKDTARLIHETIAPDGYFLSMDEIREGGWCEACERRGLSAGEILGDCITRQCAIIRDLNPHADIFIWSDMLDPGHNARDNYYLFKGDLTDSWEHVPKDLIIACWYYDIRDKSLRHFSAHGFRTLGCGYYDKADEKQARDWMESLAETPGSCGIMYTTWRDDYDFLETFANVVRRATSPGSRSK